MATRIVKLAQTTLDSMATEARAAELGAELKDLANEKEGNFAIYELTGFHSPAKGLKFLPSPSVGPAGASKICTGKLTVGGQAIDVDAYRLA